MARASATVDEEVRVIAAVAVVVPVHDEAEHLPACLAALGRAARALEPEAEPYVVVVLDACRDASESIARAWALEDGARRAVLTLDARNVGRARAAGMAHALTALARHDPSRLWLATTDADTVVPEGWLTHHLRVAREGAEAVAGSIRVVDWSEYPPGFGERFTQLYEPRGDGDTHPHVHGANLGVRADAYLASGGFEPLATGEDHALWRALERAARARVSSRTLHVVTSARTRGRAPAGFSGFLANMLVDRASPESA